MPYDPFADNPFMQLGPQSRGPALLPDDESSTLGRLLEGSLGGLGYIGKVLDKTFGARAVRGILGGRPQEALSVLPFSDTLGLTNEQNAVQGTDLNHQLGITDPGDDSFTAQALGFGTEVLTDPSTWFGAAVPRLLARGGGVAGRGLGAATEALTGLNPYTFGARKLGDLYDAASVPVKALFNPSSGGAWTRTGQGLAEGTYTPALNAAQNVAQQSYAGARVDLSDLFGKVQDPAVLRRAALQNSEGFEAAARQTLAAGGMDPASIDQVINVTGRFADETRNANALERSVGGISKEFQDVPKWVSDANEAAQAAGQPLPYPGNLPFAGYQPAQYAPRTLAPWDAEAGVSRYAAHGMSGTSQFQKGREDMFLGIPGGTDAINQLAKTMAPQLAGGTLTPLSAEDQLARMLTNLPGVPANHPVRGQAKDLADWLGNLPAAAHQHGVFSDDVLGSGLVRQLEAGRVHATGQTVIEGLSSFSRPVQDLEREGIRYKTVPEVLQQMGLTQTDVNGVPIAADQIANRLGLQGAFNINALKGMAVPEDVALDMARIGQAWKTPAVLQPVVDFWDKTVQLFKSYLTAPFAGFHFRNLMSGAFNMWRDGIEGDAGLRAGSDVIAMLRGGTISPEVAAKLYPNLPLDLATKELQKELVANRLAFTGNNQVTDLAGKEVLTSPLPAVGGAVRPLGQDLGQFAGGYTKGWGDLLSSPFDPDANPIVRQGRALGNTIEDWIRSTHYLANREKGLSAIDAANQVHKYQIDYSALTEFERNAMKRMFPWYTFSRRSLPPLLDDLANNPWKVASATRLLTGVREPGEFVPPWIAEGASIPLPGAPDGQQRYISSFGLPMEDELVKTLGSAMQGDPQRVFQQLFGMSQPFVKLPAEIATGVQMYSGRKLEDLKPYQSLTLGGLVPEDTARVATQVLGNSPASRFFSTADKLTDPRKSWMDAAINTLTGARITDVETDKVKERVAQDLLKEMLRGKPGVRAREDVYVPADQLQRLSPDDLMEYNLLKEIQKRSQARARAAKAER